MHTKGVLKAITVVLGIVFLLSILTVESHARDQGSLAAKLPTIIDGTLEYAFTVNDTVEFDVFRAVAYLPLSPGMFFSNKATTPPQIYRGPPPAAF